MKGRAVLMRERLLRRVRFAAAAITVMATAAASTAENQKDHAMIRVHVNEPLGVIDPMVFGYFTELTLSSYQGTMWSEMLIGRKFYETDEEKLAAPRTGTSKSWRPMSVDTYASLMLDKVEYYSAPFSQRITLTPGGTCVAGIQQSGFKREDVPDPFSFKKGARYAARLAIKNRDCEGPVHVALGASPQEAVAHHAFETAGDDWAVYEAVLTPSANADEASFMVYIDKPGTVWVDSVSLTPAALVEQGFRKDAIAFAKEIIAPTNLRFPGGCFADDYDWKEGIGPRDKRPAMYNRAWRRYNDHDVGTDEFIAFCRLLDAEPYICVNCGTGTPQDAADWVEYCNGPADTKWGGARAANGHPEPYNVKYWNVGNEMYLPTEFGGTNGVEYGKAFRAFAEAMRAADPTIKLVAVGCFEPPAETIEPIRSNALAWSALRYHIGFVEGLLEEAGDAVDILAIHYYDPHDVGGAGSLEQVNAICLSVGEDFNAKLDALYETMARHAPEGKHIPVALDEWATWVRNEPELPVERKLPEGLDMPRGLGLHGVLGMLRNTLAEATIVNVMQRRPGDFALGCKTLLTSLAMGDMGISRDNVIASPSGLMMGMYSTREACQALRTEAACDTFDAEGIAPLIADRRGAPYLDVSARLHPDGSTVDVFVVNRNLDEAITSDISFGAAFIEGAVEAAVLDAKNIYAWNTFENPEVYRVERRRVEAGSSGIAYEFAAHSLTRLTFQLKPGDSR